MMHCPKCQHAAHARSSRYLSINTKERYHQCQNINCSCTFKTHESIADIIVDLEQFMQFNCIQISISSSPSRCTKNHVKRSPRKRVFLWIKSVLSKPLANDILAISNYEYKKSPANGAFNIEMVTMWTSLEINPFISMHCVKFKATSQSP
jgi:hypothetical protein